MLQVRFYGAIAGLAKYLYDVIIFATNEADEGSITTMSLFRELQHAPIGQCLTIRVDRRTHQQRYAKKNSVNKKIEENLHAALGDALVHLN